MSSKNERLKLRATFWNNLAVATTAGAFLIPIYTVMRDPAVFYAKAGSMLSEPVITVAIGAVVAAFAMKTYAGYLLSQMDD